MYSSLLNILTKTKNKYIFFGIYPTNNLTSIFPTFGFIVRVVYKQIALD